MILFPEKLRQLREASGLRQRDLAKAIGVDVPMYSRFEHGERRPKRAQVLKIAKILNADAEDLIGRWLAFAALGEIGNDAWATKAISFLKEALHVEDEPSDLLSDTTTNTTISPTSAVSEMPRLTPMPKPFDGKRNLVALAGNSIEPQLFAGDTLDLLLSIEDNSIDCAVTQLPKEAELSTILATTEQLYRALSAKGSIWLHVSNDLPMFAMRLAEAMEREQGWILAHDIAWSRGDNTNGNHIANSLHHILHFVKNEQYHFDDLAFRSAFSDVELATKSRGKTGGGYRRKIENSTTLNDSEKTAAIEALNDALARQERGEIADFRLYLRESMIPVSEDSERGIAINKLGFYMKINDNGVPSNLWNFAVERSRKHGIEVMPKQVAKIIIAATSPEGGLVIDPFCNIANVCRVAKEMKRRSIGIDSDAKLIAEVRQELKPTKPEPRQTTLSLF